MLHKRSLLFFCALLASSLQVTAAEEAKTVTPTPPTTQEVTALPPAVAPTVAAPVVPVAKVPFTPFTGAINRSKVRMRTQPTLEAHVVRETSKGELFAVMGESNGYYAVAAPKGAKGYIFRTFVLDGTVEGDRVNVRLYPDIDAPVIAQLNSGDKVHVEVSDPHSKWLEIDLPATCRFYIAHEYLEKKGPVELVATMEKRSSEATHLMSAATLYAQAEIQKPFEQIDLDKITAQFEQIAKDFSDLPLVARQVQEATALIQDVYVQKKIAFLEGKSDHMSITQGISAENLNKLAKIGIEIRPAADEKQIADVASAATQVIGLTSPMSDEVITDKMMVWQPLEESMYHLWAASNGEKSMDEFYSEEQENATVLSGIVEPYSRPVKNRPGDFLLRSNNHPVAFLYSTRVNLEKFVGQKVTLIAAPRPNHNFAFPAYFVINVE